VVSVSSYSHADAHDFLSLAGKIRIGTIFEVFDIGDANVALERLSQGRIKDAAVLQMKERETL
jgi:D-arabinose 1-dehydrogenase-like Zn-dependent alcohol dehydrogenase